MISLFWDDPKMVYSMVCCSIVYISMHPLIIIVTAILKIIIVTMIIIISGSPGFRGECVPGLKKKWGVEGAAPGRRSPPLFANGSNTSRNTNT